MKEPHRKGVANRSTASSPSSSTPRSPVAEHTSRETQWHWPTSSPFPPMEHGSTGPPRAAAPSIAITTFTARRSFHPTNSGKTGGVPNDRPALCPRGAVARTIVRDAIVALCREKNWTLLALHVPRTTSTWSFPPSVSPGG